MASAEPAPPAKPRCRTPAMLVIGMAGSGKTTLVSALSLFLEESDFSMLEAAEATVASSSAADAAGSPSAADAATGSSSAAGAAAGSSSTADAATGGSSAFDAAGGGSSASDAAAGSSSAANADDRSSPPRETSDPAFYAGYDGESLGAYVVNLDPAVGELPYDSNVDIRDTVKYKDVMRSFSLGPNGAILTSLNLFATRFDQVLTLLELRAPTSRAVVVDTPGQIESFTWSASGAIMTEALANVLPTVVLFVVDTPRCSSPMTFVSNMLYACSIMYKTNLPLVVVFNKVDVESSKLAQSWLRDFDAFDTVLKEDNFAGTLARSIAQALEEFYSVMRCVSVSAVTEEGLDDLMEAVAGAVVEYEQEYLPSLQQRRAERKAAQTETRTSRMAELEADLQDDKALSTRRKTRDTMWGPEVQPPVVLEGRSSLEAPGKVVEAGAGSERLRNLRRDTGPELGWSRTGTGADRHDAKAYSDFVRYLDALKTTEEGNEEGGGAE